MAWLAKKAKVSTIQAYPNENIHLDSDVELRIWDKVVSFFRQPAVIEAEVRRILYDMHTDTVENDFESIRADLAESEKLYGKMYAKLTQAMADDDDMLATRLEADCKPLAEEIKAYQNVVGQLEARLAAKERTAKVTRELASYCRKISDAFDTVDIPFERKVQMLSAVRVKVLSPLKWDTQTSNKFRLSRRSRLH